jgi:hypothetical protein
MNYIRTFMFEMGLVVIDVKELGLESSLVFKLNKGCVMPNLIEELS